MPTKKVHEDQKYIDGLVQNNSFIINTIYKKFVPKVIHYINNNSGSSEKAKDIIQETLVTIYHQAKDKKLQLTCPFDAYFFLLCKRKWLNELKKNSNKKVTNLNEEVYKIEGADELALQTSIYEEKYSLFESMFEKLGKGCKELLKTCFATKSVEIAAKKLEISYAYARKKKSLCTGKLTELIKSSPTFNQIKNNL